MCMQHGQSQVRSTSTVEASAPSAHRPRHSAHREYCDRATVTRPRFLNTTNVILLYVLRTRNPTGNAIYYHTTRSPFHLYILVGTSTSQQVPHAVSRTNVAAHCPRTRTPILHGGASLWLGRSCCRHRSRPALIAFSPLRGAAYSHTGWS